MDGLIRVIEGIDKILVQNSNCRGYAFVCRKFLDDILEYSFG